MEEGYVRTSFEWKFTQIGKSIMTRSRLLVPTAICAKITNDLSVH
jgi:hypothetical protein